MQPLPFPEEFYLAVVQLCIAALKTALRFKAKTVLLPSLGHTAHNSGLWWSGRRPARLASSRACLFSARS